MSTLAKRSPRVKPVSVTYRWHRAIVWPCLMIPDGAAGCLEINGTCYDVLPLCGNGSGPDAPVLGYRLSNLANGKTYDIDAHQEHWLCDCPDSVFANRADGLCKHRKALRLALAERGQL